MASSRPAFLWRYGCYDTAVCRGERRENPATLPVCSRRAQRIHSSKTNVPIRPNTTRHAAPISGPQGKPTNSDPPRSIPAVNRVAMKHANATAFTLCFSSCILGLVTFNKSHNHAGTPGAIAMGYQAALGLTLFQDCAAFAAHGFHLIQFAEFKWF